MNDSLHARVIEHFFTRQLPSQSSRWRYFDFREIAWFADSLKRNWTLNLRVWQTLQAMVNRIHHEGTALFIDFTNVKGTGFNANVDSHDFIVPEGVKVVFWDMPSDWVDQMRNAVGRSKAGLSLGADNALWWNNEDQRSLASRRDELFAADEQQVRAIITDSFTPFVNGNFEILRSTPIRSSGIYNSQKIIGRPADFMRCCLALSAKCDQAFTFLADDNDVRREHIRLLILSPRSAPFGGALSRLCNLGFDISGLAYNHNSVMAQLPTHYDRGISYIYLADFVVGGTELRLAQTIAAHRHSAVEHCVCLASYCEPSVYQHRGKPVIHPIIARLSQFSKTTNRSFELAD